MSEQIALCSACGRMMAFVKTLPPQERDSSGEHILIPLDSAIFCCDKHGAWRVYTSGAITRYQDPAAD